jgi:Tfp pilus assembly protein PilF
MRLRLTSVIAIACLVTACARQPHHNPPVVEGTLPPPAAGTPLPPDTPVEPARPAPVQPVRQLADGAQLPAVKGLIGTADRALAKGDVELASVNLERAQRLAPQSAQVYQKLARVRLKQKRPAEAEQLARKALAFAGTPQQQAELWRLIASARRQNGQQAAAQEAEARATTLEAGTVGGQP